jgi:signal transduction histidine kinase
VSVRWLSRMDTRIALALAGCTTLVCWLLCVGVLIALWCAVARSDAPPEELTRLVRERATEGSAFSGRADFEARERWLRTLEGQSAFRIFIGARFDVYADRARVVSRGRGDTLCSQSRQACRTDDGLWLVMAPIGGDGDRLAVSFRGDAATNELRPLLVASAFLALAPAGGMAGTVTLVVVAFVTRGLRGRTRRIKEVVERWSRDRFDARILDGVDDELGGVCAQLDLMASALNQTRERDRAWGVYDERMRLLRLLHDDVKQDLFAATIHLGLAADAPPSRYSSSHDQAPIGRATFALERARHGLERLMSGSAPVTGTEASLSATVKLLVETWGREVVVEGELTDKSRVPSLLVAFVRETIINAFRHAAAARVIVRCGQDSASVWVVVIDDGRGGEAPFSGTTRGGLSRLRDEIEREGGLMTIDVTDGGANVRLVLPRSRLSG